ncbi:MAG: helix-turn-helix transcriptional regulator [Dehalococcoidia bacterium]
MPTIINRRGRPPYPDILTPSEWQVLEGVRAGRTNQEIASQLGVTFHTVKFHISNMLSKLHLEDRQQLARWRPRRDSESAPAPGHALVSWAALKLVVAGAGGVALLAGVTFAVLAIRGDDSEPVSAALPTSTPRATATPTAPPAAANTCPAAPAPLAARAPALVPPTPTAGVEARVLGRGHAFARLQFQVKLTDAAPAGSRARAEGLSVTAYTPNGPLAVAVRPGGLSSGGAEGLVFLTLDTDPLPEDTLTVMIDAPAFGFLELRTGCLEGRTSGPFTGVAPIDPGEPLPEDLSGRAPDRIDSGFGWAYVIDGLDRDGPTSMWVTYHAEGNVDGLVPDSPTGQVPLNYLPFFGSQPRTARVLIPQGATSATVTFGGARRLADRSQPHEDAPLESGDWTITIPLD